MFTWICPQCGGEVMPSQEECPRCVKPAAVETPKAPAVPEPAPAPVPAPIPVAAPTPAPIPTPIVTPVPTPAPAPAQAPAPVAAAPVYAAPPTNYDALPEHRSTGVRDVLVTFGVAVVLLGGGYFFWTRNERAEKAAQAPKVAMEEVKGAKGTHPLAKQIEVTGLRLRMPKPGQAEVQMVVVNHSAAEIAGLNMDVVLGARGSAKEVAVFSVKVKQLSPFGSTEVSAKAKSEVSAIDIPDWQFLEPKVLIQANEP